jgi:hypothetical protein
VLRLGVPPRAMASRLARVLHRHLGTKQTNCHFMWTYAHSEVIISLDTLNLWLCSDWGSCLDQWRLALQGSCTAIWARNKQTIISSGHMHTLRSSFCSLLETCGCAQIGGPASSNGVSPCKGLAPPSGHETNKLSFHLDICTL